MLKPYTLKHFQCAPIVALMNYIYASARQAMARLTKWIVGST